MLYYTIQSKEAVVQFHTINIIINASQRNDLKPVVISTTFWTHHSIIWRYSDFKFVYITNAKLCVLAITGIIWGFLQPRMIKLRVTYNLCFCVCDKSFFVFASAQCFPHFGESVKLTERKLFVLPICGVLEKLLSHFKTWDIFNPNSSSHSILLQWGICTCCSHTKLLSHKLYVCVGF